MKKFFPDRESAARYVCATAPAGMGGGYPPTYFQPDDYCGTGAMCQGAFTSTFGLFRAYTTEQKNVGECEEEQGNTCNPVNIGTSSRFLTESDYLGAGVYPVKFMRYYQAPGGSQVFAPTMALGVGWSHSYNRFVLPGSPNTPTTAIVSRPGGKAFRFDLVGSDWTSDSAVRERLFKTATNWQVVTSDDEVETYDNSGRLLSIADRVGLTHTLSYDGQGRLASVADEFGRTLTFTYGANNQIQTMTDPAGGVYSYGYDAAINLVTVIYPDTRNPARFVRTYVYNEAAFAPSGAGLTNYITGVVDENNSRFANYGYDSSGRSILTEHALGANKMTISYGADPVVTRHVSATQTLVRTYTFATTSQAFVRNTGVDGPCPNCRHSSIVLFPGNGFIQQATDFNANITKYERNDPLGRADLETKRIEAFGTAQERTITTQWHPNYRLPTQIVEPCRRTTITYGGPNDANPGNRGSVLTRTIEGTTDPSGWQGACTTPVGGPRVWTYSYNANGQILTVDGPRTDAPDVTTYAYYTDNATCTGASALGCRGQIQFITNAEGHKTQITEYNAHGQPLRATDPNGLVTILTYDPRQRLTSRNFGGEITAYLYDGIGQLTKVILPDGSFLQYTYDAAHRLTQIADNLGNRIAYTVDLAGNRTLEQVFDPASELAQTRTRVYNNLSRLAEEIGAQNQTTAYGYDNQGNLTSIDGPLAGAADTTVNTYDTLNRLIRITDPNSGQMNYGYNGLDQVTSVSDPRGLVTNYSIDGLSNLLGLQSPDTGATANTYDAAGNLKTQTDAKGQVATYIYDALNRLTSIDYQGEITHTFQYDQGNYGLGRLTQVTEPNSATQYAHDQKGRLTSETRTIAGVAYVTGYSYDSAGRLTGMTYPSGRTLTYTRDSRGRTSQILTSNNNITQTVLVDVTYRPFGSAKDFTLGNGQTYSRGFDQDGRISSYTLATQSIAVGYDAASRITCLSTGNCTSPTAAFGYDLLDRLTSYQGQGQTQDFSYDAVGNRLTKTVGMNKDTYTNSATSNRLSSITGITGRTYSYDNNGSALGDSVNQFSYDPRGRLSQAISATGTSDYQVTALGQRIRKTTPKEDIIFHYDAQGRLVAESSPAGTTQVEYIYLDDVPVAILK